MKRGAFMLPVVAVIAVALLIGVQLAAGGDDFDPNAARDACAERPAQPIAPDVEALAERVVLVGVDNAACDLGISRERLVLALATDADRLELADDLGISEQALSRALRDGIAEAIVELDKAGQLPKVSALMPAIVEELKLPGFAEGLVERIPDGVVDDILPTRAVLERSLAKIDIQRVLENIQDPQSLDDELTKAIRDAALDEARQRLQKRIDSVSGVFDELF